MTQAKTAQLDEAALREAALAYLARYGGPEAALARMLARRIRRWAEMRAAEGAEPGDIAAEALALRTATARIVADLARLGAVNDAAFAASRARRLRRAGRSRRAVLAHLATRGIGQETAGDAVPEDEAAEFAAALAFARRRRVGPFATNGGEASDDAEHEEMETDSETDSDSQRRILAAFARAGFSGGIARRALACEREEAEVLLRAAAQAG